MLLGILSFFLFNPSLDASQRSRLMGMAIERIEQTDQKIEVVTTGARFVFRDKKTLDIYQKIPKARWVGTLRFPRPLFHLGIAADETGKRTTLLDEEDGYCVRAWGAEGANLRICGDSVLVYRHSPPKEKPKWFRRTSQELLSVRGEFQPTYSANDEGRWLLMDGEGGLGLFPVELKKPKEDAITTSRWSLDYPIAGSEEVWISVFPPRHYNTRRARESVAHEGWRDSPSAAYPSSRVLQEDARFSKTIVLHSYLWPGGAKEPWYITDFIPSNRKALRRVQEDCRRLGLRLSVYFSPFYAAVSDFFGQIERALAELKIESLYYDGISMDFRKSYEIVKKTRRLLGDERLLLTHSSHDPFGSLTLFAPFIDTYSDYILRGEMGTAGLDLDRFLRYVVSGYNTSNAVGLWIYYGVNFNAGNPKYVSTLPPDDHVEAALRNHTFLWLTTDMWRRNETKVELENFLRRYRERLKRTAG